MKRAHISLKTKLAAALLTIKRVNEDGELEHVIRFGESKHLTADQIIARFRFDHWPIRHADGGPDEPWNLEPRPVAEHDKKTAEIDVPQIAKQKRIRQRIHRAVKALQIIADCDDVGDEGAAGGMVDIARAALRESRARPRQKIPSRRNAWPKGRKLK